MNIGKLKKLTKDELIIEYKILTIRVNELKKEVETQSKKWFNYHRGKAWREEKLLQQSKT